MLRVAMASYYLYLFVYMYLLTSVRCLAFFAYYTAVLLEMEACPVFQWRWRRPLPAFALILLPHFYDVVPSEMSFVLVTWEFKASRLCCIKQVPPYPVERPLSNEVLMFHIPPGSGATGAMPSALLRLKGEVTESLTIAPAILSSRFRRPVITQLLHPAVDNGGCHVRSSEAVTLEFLWKCTSPNP